MKARLLALLVGLGLVWLPTTAGAIPPPPKKYTVYPNGTDPGCYIMGSSGNLVLGQGATWANADSIERTVRQRDGFWTYVLSPAEEAERTMQTAGKFLEQCDSGPYSHAVNVVVTAPLNPAGTSFTVRWANAPAASTLRYDVRYKIGLNGAYHLWKNDTALKSATFTGQVGKTYYFEARTIKPATGKMTNYSPGKKVIVD